jgi:hypothetical protein
LHRRSQSLWHFHAASRNVICATCGNALTCGRLRVGALAFIWCEKTNQCAPPRGTTVRRAATFPPPAAAPELALLRSKISSKPLFSQLKKLSLFKRELAQQGHCAGPSFALQFERLREKFLCPSGRAKS